MSFEIKLPNSGGTTTDVSMALAGYLSRHYPQWQSHEAGITCIPIATIPSWTGAVDDGLRKLLWNKTSKEQLDSFVKNRSGLARGTKAEKIVLESLVKCFREVNDARVLLINGAKLTQKHLDLVSQFMGWPVPTFNMKELELEIDLLVLHQQLGLLIFEIKAQESSVKSGKGRSQLKSSTSYLAQIIAGVYQNYEETVSQATVSSIIAYPFKSRDPQERGPLEPSQAGGRRYIFKETLETTSQLRSFWESFELCKIPHEVFEKLFQALVLLRIPVFGKQHKASFDSGVSISLQQYELNMLNLITSSRHMEGVMKQQEKYKKDARSSGSKSGSQPTEYATAPLKQVYGTALAALSCLRMYLRSVENWDASKEIVISLWEKQITHRLEALDAEIIQMRIKNVNSDRGVLNQLMFLTPEQSAIWNNSSPSQVIDGYACTGKTVLILNKALELLRELELESNSNNRSVAIIIPSFLHPYYHRYFEANLSNYAEAIESKGLVICDVSQFLNATEHFEESYHLFFDEFCASLQEFHLAVAEKYLDRVKSCVQSTVTDRIIWLAQDPNQSIGSSENMLKLGELSDMIMRSGKGEASYLTLSLRCTSELFEFWSTVLSSRNLRQGHSIFGPKPEIFREKLPPYTGHESRDRLMASLACKYLNNLCAMGHKCSDIGIVFYNPKDTLNDRIYWSRMIKDYILENGEKVPNLSTDDVQAVTAQLLDLLLSYEFPIVIFIDHPELPEPIDTAKYMAYTRSIVKLIYVSVAMDTTASISKDIFSCMLTITNLANRAQIAFHDFVNYVCLKGGEPGPDFRATYQFYLGEAGKSINECFRKCREIGKIVIQSRHFDQRERQQVIEHIKRQTWGLMEPFSYWKNTILQQGLFNEDQLRDLSKIDIPDEFSNETTMSMFSLHWDHYMSS